MPWLGKAMGQQKCERIRYFWFELAVWDHGRRRGFRFSVDDARAPDHLFLVAAEEI